MFDHTDSPLPLYRAVDTFLARDRPRHQLLRLRKCFDRHGLPLPVDLSAALETAGIPLIL